MAGEAKREKEAENGGTGKLPLTMRSLCPRVHISSAPRESAVARRPACVCANGVTYFGSLRGRNDGDEGCCTS